MQWTLCSSYLPLFSTPAALHVAGRVCSIPHFSLPQPSTFCGRSGFEVCGLSNVVFPWHFFTPHSLRATSCAACPPSSNSVLLPFRGWRVVGGGERGTRSLAPGLFGRAQLYPGSCARKCTAEGAVCPPSRERNDAPSLSCARRAHSRRGSSPPS